MQGKRANIERKKRMVRKVGNNNISMSLLCKERERILKENRGDFKSFEGKFLIEQRAAEGIILHQNY